MRDPRPLGLLRRTALRSSTAHSPRLRALQMPFGNPALIVCFCATCDSRAIRSNDARLIRWIDLLRTAGRTFRALAALASSFLLREECRDPGVVDEVDRPAEGCCEEEVEEDAVQRR
jgi:hypothetical protein